MIIYKKSKENRKKYHETQLELPFLRKIITADTKIRV